MAMRYIPIFILLFLSSSCKSDDQLTHAKPLTHGDTLISNGGGFALGFFSPTSSNTSLYLGIWYHNIPGPITVVWVANRDNPILAPSSPVLAITNSSDLVLSDSQGRTPWAVKKNSTGAGATAVLLDEGNLVLRLPNGKITWQSFDHPTDTILPKMRFLVSYKAKVAMRLVAWKGPDDPSSGDFSCSGDPSSPDLQFVTWNKTEPYCRITVWSGKSVSGGTYLTNTSSVLYQTTVNSGDEFYVTYTISDNSTLMRLMIDYTGKLKYLSWNRHTSSWAIFGEHPSVPCELYASCGPFSYCDFTQITPACQCLDGFEPDDGVNFFSKGCYRQEALKCGKQSHFAPLSGMKVPDNFLHIRNRSLDECAAECRRNCSCTAYAYSNLSSAGAMADPSRCLVWSGELIDAGKSTSGENMYIRLADSPAGNKKHSTEQILLPIITFLLLLACIALVGIYKYKAGKWRKKKNQKKLMLGYFSTSKELEGNSTEFPSVTFEDILSATNFFADSNLLGRGGFGKVYKGTFEGENVVAVKRLSQNSGQGTVEFRNEVVLIAKLQHKNLVRLLGCCIHGDEKLLIYEYLPNKSLDSYLFDGARKYELDWLTRFKIIKGIARGILYLHQDSRLTIIHRDLKASNILLDKEMTPKISDFGMARIFGANQNQANTNRVVGTYGYMSPEYAMRGAFSVKSDTYSFGVLLLEIISGLKISSPQLLANFSSLITYAWRLWEDEKATELVDCSVVASCPLHEVLRCIHVGLLCVQDHPNDRPLMSSVMYMIENQNALLPTPKQPIYFAESNYEGGEAREMMENSMNEISITTLEGR
ncbi:G-type lectin S-receptor-like serine/threonine-protein kinase B120 isoform X1 [Lolium rigidum]|uniref:G-type lectin S-receptor-like serine/threonine-protein kinase B120 isoform X1 n=1 Tax=Lolium rigidum TaxID=89674 RepID=UPI001F5CA247|nr:G-type lectin S-receptor-like serine/threonine-protein kinase B120 isoform X1 [Lolium rigidum]